MAKLDRRDFVKLVGAGSVGAGAGFMLAETIKHPVEYLVPYAVPPEDYSPGIATWYNTVCSMCSAGCGISVRIREGRAKKIEGNPSHPVSQGRTCALGQAGLQVLYNPDRLTGPMMRSGERGSGQFVPTTWSESLADVAGQLTALTDNGKSDSICLLTGDVRGHLAPLMTLFMRQLGSERLLHYDFTSPHALYAANKQVFGEDRLPYYDLENAHYVLSFGADFLGTWLSPVHYGLGFGRSRQGHRDFRGRFVQVEPRMSLSGAAADEWIAARPGTEGLLALGMAHRIVTAGRYRGADRGDWKNALAPYAPETVAEQTDVSATTIERLADSFADTQPSLAIGGGAAANHSNGVNSLVAINLLNYLVGNIGKPGGVIFNSEPTAGPASPSQANYQSMRKLADDAGAGKIDALIISDSNPVFELPAGTGVADALAQIPLIISLSNFMDDTAAMADVILPSHTYLESWGDDVPEPGVGFPVGAISQPVVAPLYNTRAKGDIILGLAQQMGMDEALPWTSMEQYLKQQWQRIYESGISAVQAESFEAFWTSILQAGVWGENLRRDPSTSTFDRSVIDALDAEVAQFSGAEDEFPFMLQPYLSHALRDGRGANLPWMQELPDPMTGVVYSSWVEVNPATAADLGLTEGDLVQVSSPHGQVTAPVLVYPAIRPDVIAMPIGQGHREYGRYAGNRGVNPVQILAPDIETAAGSLAWAATRVRLATTGRRVALIKSGGESRELGRGIVQTTGSGAAGDHSARLNSIPITVVQS